MASITIAVGEISSTIETTNEKGQTSFDLFVEQHGGPSEGTEQEKLDFVTERLLKYITDSAKDRKRHQFLQEVEVTMRAQVDAVVWAPADRGKVK